MVIAKVYCFRKHETGKIPSQLRNISIHSSSLGFSTQESFADLGLD
jgi:hypothetical protein